MIFDVHVHVGKETKTGKKNTIPETLSYMQEHDIKHAAVFPFSEGNLIQNSLDLLEKHPSLHAFLRFDPKTISIQQLRTLLSKPFKGVKLHPHSENFDPRDPHFSPIFSLLAKARIPVLIHTTKTNNPLTDPVRIANLCQEHPDLILILGHFASKQPELQSLLSTFPNLYVETSLSATPFSIQKIVNTIGANKILYGSDYPFSYHQIELPKIYLSKIPQEAKRKILYENAAKLFKIDQPGE